MKPENPDIEQWKPGLLDHVGDFFRRLPAAWIVIVTVALLAFALWLGRAWSPHFFMIYAIKTAPLVTTSSARPGLVKLSGKAQPGSKHVLVRDVSGACVIDPQEAVILTRSEGKSMFGSSISRTEQAILPGDPVFAIGEIRRDQARNAAGTCRLRSSAQGVLLVSGVSEEAALFRFRLYFWPTIGGMFLSLGMAVWGFRSHLQGYPHESVGELVDALKTRPWMRYPGAEP